MVSVPARGLTASSGVAERTAERGPAQRCAASTTRASSAAGAHNSGHGKDEALRRHCTKDTVRTKYIPYGMTFMYTECATPRRIQQLTPQRRVPQRSSKSMVWTSYRAAGGLAVACGLGTSGRTLRAAHAGTARAASRPSSSPAAAASWQALMRKHSKRRAKGQHQPQQWKVQCVHRSSGVVLRQSTSGGEGRGKGGCCVWV